MAFNNLNEFVKALEKANELVRITAKVSPNLEISEINDRVIKNNGKALLFENVEGSDFPILINAMGSKKRIELAFNVNNIEDVAKEIQSIFDLMKSPKKGFINKIKLFTQLKKLKALSPTKSEKRGLCQEIILSEVDLKKLPILTTWPFDGGPFITFPVVHSISLNKTHNMGMYRMQVLDKETTGMHWHLHKGGATHYNEYKTVNKRMPITVTLGGNPIYTYAATAPLPEEIDEYMLAGFLKKESVKLVKCITNDIYIPEDVDFVLEGYVDPNENLFMEGPFGDHTGYYSLADLYPKFHITHITHKKNPIFPATVVGIPPQEDAFIGLATERIFLNPIKMTMIPELTDMHMPAEGVFHNIVLSSINKKYPGQSNKVMNALWGAGQMMFNKYLIILDKDISLTNYNSVLENIIKNTNPVEDILFSRGPMDVLDHASEEFAQGGKMGIDATRKPNQNNLAPNINEIKIKQLENILEVNTTFIDKGLGLLILKIEKQKNITKILSEKLLQENLISNVKFVIYIESVADINSYADIVWRVANNSDPNRDNFYILNKETNKPYPTLFIDGLRKNKECDNFNRDWPNIVCMDEETIKLVDKRWNEYNIGEFIKSPSEKYRKQLYKGKAVAE